MRIIAEQYDELFHRVPGVGVVHFEPTTVGRSVKGVLVTEDPKVIDYFRKRPGLFTLVGPATEPKSDSKPVKAIPAARKLARERGIDLSTITGTGKNGTIVVKDVEAAIAGS